MKRNYKLSRSIVFKRWARKRYSLFQVMNKLVAIGVLSVIYLNASASKKQVSLFLPCDTIQNIAGIELDEVSITGKKSPEIFPDALKIVNVLSKTELERAPTLNLAEILRQASHIDIRQRGAEDIQADISLRGGTFDQTMIRFNGINITDPQTGHYSLDLPVSFRQISRIEIIGGATSQNSDSGAFSGAINIVTKPGEKNAFDASIFYGNHNLLDVNLAGTIVTGKLNHLLAVSRKKSDGYMKNTDFDTKNIYAHTSGNFDAGQLDVMFGISTKEFGANAFYSAKYPEQFDAVKTIFAALKWKIKSPLNFAPAVYWRRHTDRFELFRCEKPDWYTGHNYHLTDIAGSSLNAWILTKAGKTAWGTEIRSENIRSNVLGDEMAKPIKVTGKDAYYTRSKSRTHFSAFAEHVLQHNKWTLAGGISFHHNINSELKGEIYPYANFGWQLLPQLRFYASASRSFRLPTFTDLYYSGPVNVGNPDLKPEKTALFDAGCKFESKNISATINIYHQKGENLIDWIKYQPDEVWKTENITTLKNNGLEISLSVFPENMLQRKFFIPEARIHYLATKLQKPESDFISYYVLDNLKHKLNINLSHHIFKKLDMNWSLTYQQRNGKYIAYIDGEETEKQYSPFCLLDCKLIYTIKYISFHLLVNNLADVGYVDIGNVPQPGRWIKLGVQIKIE